MSEKPCVGGFREGRRRQITVARALVAQGAINQDELGRRSVVGDLAGGRNANEQAVPRDRNLFAISQAGLVNNLKERFARGEIDKDEFEERRRVLGE
ncbi:MAG: SHOCT domain-containing protein [Mesorhizobium sp.]|nr:SHOCT domain-containing protein [Mesorhizobium sp.]MCO5163940.1 SHOCT domain-containing protein [Mesorhizobium sp.]